MNRITGAGVELLPYLLVVTGVAAFLLPSGEMFRGTAILAVIAGLAIFKLQIDMRAQASIPLDRHQKGNR